MSEERENSIPRNGIINGLRFSFPPFIISTNQFKVPK